MFPVSGAVVLMYHSIGENNLFFTVNGGEFEKQMAYLMRENFNVVSLKKLEEYLKKKSIPLKTIAITFDDGYKDNLLNALPVLKKYNFPATVFVMTGDIGKTRNVRGHDFDMLTQEDILILARSGLIDIEPHSVTHPKLSKLNREEIKVELKESKEVLEGLLGRDCPYFAYPFGNYSDNVIEVARGLGFRLALAVEKGVVSHTSDRLSLPRNSVDQEVSITQFKGIVKNGRL